MQDKGRPTETLKVLTSYWTDRAHSYSEQNIEEMNDWRRDAWRKMILSNAPRKERLRVLDVGTGPGFFAMNLALAGHEVTAVDVTEHMIYEDELCKALEGLKASHHLYVAASGKAPLCSDYGETAGLWNLAVYEEE